VEWEKIKHQDGKMDEFLDKLGDIMWKVGYSGEAIKDMIKSRLTSSLQRSWWQFKTSLKTSLPIWVHFENLLIRSRMINASRNVTH
jgi:hypothetical protein